MTLEVVAALLVGLAVLAVVLEPLLRSAPQPEPSLQDLQEPEETPKGLALAALREIEFDRATGKLSDDDYTDLKNKYTAQALALLRTEEGNLPAESDQIEEMIAARVRTLRGGGPTCPRCGPRPESDAVFCSHCGDRIGGSVSCAVCGKPLQARSRFCDGCGSAVAA